MGTTAALLITLGAAPGRPAAKPAIRPAPARPLINLTATSAEPRRAQLRVAGFLQAVQTGNWSRAVTFLSRRVPATERQQLLRGPWLRRTSRNDFAALVYMPQVEIRTMSFAGTRALMRVQPFGWERTRGQAYGVWSVPMVRENNQWMLEIHPM
jgi:hypothetical protein